VPPLNDMCLTGRMYVQIHQQIINSYGIATAFSEPITATS
jgi:hypothetical protein